METFIPTVEVVVKTGWVQPTATILAAFVGPIIAFLLMLLLSNINDLKTEKRTKKQNEKIALQQRSDTYESILSHTLHQQQYIKNTDNIAFKSQFFDSILRGVEGYEHKVDADTRSFLARGKELTELYNASINKIEIIKSIIEYIDELILHVKSKQKQIASELMNNF